MDERIGIDHNPHVRWTGNIRIFEENDISSLRDERFVQLWTEVRAVPIVRDIRPRDADTCLIEGVIDDA